MNSIYNKITVAIYPYSREFAPVVRYLKSLPNYEICSIISPNGWGLTGHDAGCADLGQEIGITVESDFLAAICKCDYLIVADCDMNDKTREIVLRNIHTAIEHHKNIICTLSLEENLLSDIRNKCMSMGVLFETFKSSFDNNNIDYTRESLQDINTSVVFIGGLTEETNKFHIQLSLRKSLCDAGYKVSQIGTRNYCELLGFHSFPGFMYDTGMSEVHKIIRFNTFVKMLEIVEKPDVIIVGIPGAMMKYDKKFLNKFTIFAYMISQALFPDYVIVSSLYNKETPKYFEAINNSFKHKYGFEVNCYNIANTQFDYSRSLEMNKLLFNYFDSFLIDETIENKYKEMQVPILNILNKNHISKMYDMLIGTLSTYGEIKQVPTI